MHFQSIFNIISLWTLPVILIVILTLALIRKETKPQAKRVVTQCWVDTTRRPDVLPRLLPVFQ